MATAIKKTNLSKGKKKSYKNLRESLGVHLNQNVILSLFTTFGIGGRADLFFTAREPEEMILAIRSAQKSKVRFLVLGSGSNVLFSDSGFRGLVIKNQCRSIVVNQNTITCQSGALLNDVAAKALNCSLSGLEFSAGIPGTVGGAIRGNAGAFGKSVGDLLTNAVILTRQGEIKEVDKKYFRFTYRESILKPSKDVVLSATFGLEEQDEMEIEKKMQENLKRREENLPLEEKSAGCFFKNVVQGEKKLSAGFLLDQVGAKEIRVGDAQVSNKHANILINAGNAKATEIRKLARQLKKKVKEKFDINLAEEVVYIY